MRFSYLHTRRPRNDSDRVTNEQTRDAFDRTPAQVLIVAAACKAWNEQPEQGERGTVTGFRGNRSPRKYAKRSASRASATPPKLSALSARWKWIFVPCVTN